MNIPIFVAPHERAQAIESYGDCLTEAQKDQINEAPEGRGIMLILDYANKTSDVRLLAEEPE